MTTAGAIIFLGAVLSLCALGAVLELRQIRIALQSVCQDELVRQAEARDLTRAVNSITNCILMEEGKIKKGGVNPRPSHPRPEVKPVPQKKKY